MRNYSAMNKPIITTSSMTYALKVNSVLSTHSIPSEIIRLNNDVSNTGCSYGVSIDNSYLKNALRILDSNKIPYSKVLR